MDITLNGNLAQVHGGPGRRVGVLTGMAISLAVLLCTAPDAAAQRLPRTSTLITAPLTGVVATPVTFTALTSPTPNGGTITFTAAIGNRAVALPNCPVVAATAAPASCTFVPTRVADYKLTATFSGTSSLASSVGKASVSVTAAPVAPTTTTTTASIITPAPSAYQSVTLGSSVSPLPVGGTLTFSASIAGTPVALPSNCAALALSTAGQATCAFTPTVAGTLSVSAAYSGSTTHAASTGAGSGNVAAAATTVSVTDNATSIPDGPTPALFGDTVIFTADVSPAAGGTLKPEGTVQWTLTYEGPWEAATGLGGSCAESTVSNGMAYCAITPTAWLPDPSDPSWVENFRYPITATATFVPAVTTGWASSTGADSTSKISLGALLPASNGQVFNVTSFPFYITQVQSDALGRPLENYWDSTLFAFRKSSNVLTITSIDGLPTYIMRAACPVGVDVGRSFECRWPQPAPFITLKDSIQGPTVIP